MNHGSIIHCPRCGASILVMPTVRETGFFGSSTLRLTFNHVDIEHVCDEERP